MHDGIEWAAQCKPMNSMRTEPKSEIASTAARLVVEEGLEYGPAKRRAARLLGLSARVTLRARRRGG